MRPLIAHVVDIRMLLLSTNLSNDFLSTAHALSIVTSISHGHRLSKLILQLGHAWILGQHFVPNDHVLGALDMLKILLL